MRPNLHIDDMVDLYALLLDLEDGKIAAKPSTPVIAT